MAERAAQRRFSLCGDITGQRDVTRTDHADTEKDEVGGTGVLDRVESDSGRGEDCGDAKGGGEDVEESTEESADGRLETFAASSSEGTSENVEDAWSRSDGEKKSRGEEEKKAV